MNKEEISLALNLIMDDYVNDPSKFESMQETAQTHVREKAEGKEPTYGDDIYQMMVEYLKENS